MHGVSCKFKESSASCKRMEPSASCKRKEPSARSKCKGTSAIALRGVKISSFKSLLRARGSADDTLRNSTLRGDRRGRGAKTRFFCDFALARATFCGHRRDPLRRASCTEQFAQSNLHRATCTEQLAGSNLHGVICTEQLAGSHLQGATCAEQLARSNLHRATCTEQLAQSNLRRPTCTDQFARSTLPRATRSLRRATCTCARPGLNKFAAHVSGQEKRTPPAALGRPRLRCYAFGPTVV